MSTLKDQTMNQLKDQQNLFNQKLLKKVNQVNKKKKLLKFHNIKLSLFFYLASHQRSRNAPKSTNERASESVEVVRNRNSRNQHDNRPQEAEESCDSGKKWVWIRDILVVYRLNFFLFLMFLSHSTLLSKQWNLVFK